MDKILLYILVAIVVIVVVIIIATMKTEEVYVLGDYEYTNSQAKEVCKLLNGVLATKQQVKDAFEKGAEWCAWGHREGGFSMPFQRSNVPGCNERNTKFLLEQDNPNVLTEKYSATCYGIKPDENDEIVKKYKIRPFNANKNKWNQ